MIRSRTEGVPVGDDIAALIEEVQRAGDGAAAEAECRVNAHNRKAAALEALDAETQCALVMATNGQVDALFTGQRIDAGIVAMSALRDLALSPKGVQGLVDGLRYSGRHFVQPADAQVQPIGSGATYTASVGMAASYGASTAVALLPDGGALGMQQPLRWPTPLVAGKRPSEICYEKLEGQGIGWLVRCVIDALEEPLPPVREAVSGYGRVLALRSALEAVGVGRQLRECREQGNREQELLGVLREGVLRFAEKRWIDRLANEVVGYINATFATIIQSALNELNGVLTPAEAVRYQQHLDALRTAMMEHEKGGFEFPAIRVAIPVHDLLPRKIAPMQANAMQASVRANIVEKILNEHARAVGIPGVESADDARSLMLALSGKTGQARRAARALWEADKTASS